MASKDCIFCKIVAGEMDTKMEYEDDDVVVFRDINPQAPVHLLVVPKKHIPKLSDAKEADKEVLGKIQLVAAKMAKKLGIEKAFKIALSNGKEAGQDVFHLHYHVLGGWEKQK